MGTALGITVAVVAFFSTVLVVWKCVRDVRGMYLRCPACGEVLRKEMPFIMTARCPKCGKRYGVEVRGQRR